MFPAQSYTDNVMNVALPSTYRFMEKVIRELIAMYEEAEVPLTTIHLGGDEVPEGAWMGSPVCRTFMDENGMTSAHELSEYYITKMADYLQTISFAIQRLAGSSVGTSGNNRSSFEPTCSRSVLLEYGS